eukprot:jgi/Mesvir1/18901/Mv18898-RA.1
MGSSDIKCQKCGRGDHEDVMLLCDGCNRGFHTYCLVPRLASVPADDWFCRECSVGEGQRAERVKAFKRLKSSFHQTKIDDFFRVTSAHQASSGDSVTSGGKKRRKSLSCSKRRRVLGIYRPSKDPERRLLQKQSLASALVSDKAIFIDKLVYAADVARPGRPPPSGNAAVSPVAGDASTSFGTPSNRSTGADAVSLRHQKIRPASVHDNRAQLERGGMQVMTKEDRRSYDRLKAMMARGEHPPLMVVYDPNEGFVVVADGHIPDWTVIAEYVGEVDFMCDRGQDRSDCMMELLDTGDEATSLIICSDKYAGICRYVNGINNHKKEARRKINVRSVRFDVDGQAHVLLVAIRDICTGERLYYDYNGLHHNYPTESFV